MAETQSPLSRLAEMTEMYRHMLSRNEYPVNFGEQRRGIDVVILPLGSPGAIDRLLRDVESFGFGMGRATPYSAESMEWHDRSRYAQDKLREHIAHIRTQPAQQHPHSEAD